MKNLGFFTIVMAFITTDIAARLSQQLQKDLKDGRVSLDDQTMEIKKEISGGSIIQLLDGTSERVTGINSFDKDRLKTGRAFVFDKVAINYDTDAASGKVGELGYNAQIPEALLNANLIVSQNGREVHRVPVRNLHAYQLTPGNSNEEFDQTGSLRYLLDDQEVKVELHFPPNVALPTDVKHYIYVRFKGLQTTRKVD